MVAATLGEQQEKRTAKALIEGPEYTWTKAPGGWVCGTQSGGSYLVMRNACSCPDYKHNCAGKELRCKHLVALAHKLAEETLRAAPPVVADEEARSAIIAAESELWERVFGRG